MWKNSTIMLVIFSLFIFSFSACGGSETSEPVTLDGAWTESSNDDVKFVATITDNRIEMTIDSEDSSSLYWKGTFPESGVTASEGMKITSKADEEALAESFTGSQAKSKVFTYEDGTLDFEFTIMGTTRVIHLKKG
jgi:hypothetical protein